MAKEIPELVKAATIEKIQTLDEAAEQAYKNEDYSQSAKLYQEAAKLAIEIDDAERVLPLLTWAAISLHNQRKLKESLGFLYQALEYATIEINAAEKFQAITAIIEIGVELPGNLASITKPMDKARELIQKNGKPHWWGIIKFLEGDLAKARGQFHEALNALQEGLARDNGQYPCFTKESYIDWIITCLLNLGQITEAKRYLKKMETLKTDWPYDRRERLLEQKINIALIENRFEAALEYARKLDKEYDEPSNVLEGYLSAHLPDYAKEILIQFLINRRNAESGFDRMDRRITWGDYYHTFLRLHLGLPKASQDWSSEELFEVLPSVKPEDTSLIVYSSSAGKEENRIPFNKVRIWFRNARVAYLQALSFAEMIDNKLECTYNTGQVEIRLTRLFRLYKACRGKLDKKDFMLADVRIGDMF